ncbi:MAG: NUDIX hydrolase [Balneola sp.]
MTDSKVLIEKQKSSKKVFNGKLLHVYYDEVILPDNTTSSREWIKHPGASAIVPFFENGDVMLINQFRYPAKKIFLEVPAGKIDKGESPEETALRELKEETGLNAKEVHYVGHFFPAIGYADEVIHIYVAMDMELIEDSTDDDEFVQKERIPFSKAIELVHSGEINDGKTICCLLRAEMFLKKTGRF